MTGFPLLAMAFILNLVAFLFVVCCIILILVILIQKGKGGGLSSAFGGGGAGGILGSKTGDFLTWVTIVLVGIMLILGSILVKYYIPAPSGTPGVPATRQTQPKPADSSEKPAPEPNAAVNTNNDSNSAAVPTVRVVDKPATPAESTNGTNEANQPGN